MFWSKHAPARGRTQFRQQTMPAIVDWVWEQRELLMGWENMMRLHLFLAKRRLFDENPAADLNSVRVAFPSIGPKATSENIITSLRSVDKALRAGDFEIIDDFDDD